MKILVLGHRGVIGSAVAATVETMGHQLLTTSLRLPSKYFEAVMRGYIPDGIINCISVPVDASAAQVKFAYQELPELLDTFGCPVVQPFAVDDVVEISTNAHVVKTESAHAAARASCIDLALSGSFWHTHVLAAQLMGLSLKEGGVTKLDHFLALSRGSVYEAYSNRIVSPIATTEWARQAIAVLQMVGHLPSVIACGGHSYSEAAIWEACARAAGREDLVQGAVVHETRSEQTLLKGGPMQVPSLYTQMRTHVAIVAGTKQNWRELKKSKAAVVA